MLSTKLKEAAGNSADATLYVDDVFSTYLYTGNGSTQTITNGIDLAGKGGMVWIKSRSAATDHKLTDTIRGATKALISNTTGAETTDTTGLTAFSSTGFSLGSSSVYNTNAATYASWTFREAAKFFDVQTVSHTNGTANNIDLSVLGTVGMVIAKNTTTVGDWDVWHRSLTAGNNLQLNLINAQSTTNAWLSVSGTTATLAAAAPTGTYVIYAYAHDTSSTGIIQCGSFTGNITVNIGFEPQWILLKTVEVVEDWYIHDTIRGCPVSGDARVLYPNLASAEGSTSQIYPNATGFSTLIGPLTYIYMAIRRPNKPPTSGTQVYNAIARTGTSATATITAGLTPDLFISKGRISGYGSSFKDRLRGVKAAIDAASTGAERTGLTNEVISFDMNGVTVGTDSYGDTNSSAATYINYTFKRAPGFFDVVCWTGDGTNPRSLSHNLTVAPTLIITKKRNAVSNWITGYDFASTTYKYFNLNDIGAATSDTYTNSPVYGGNPTSSVFIVGNQGNINITGDTYVSYLFATLAGISKVGSYTGNGTSQNIECGFAAGARFFLVKATSTTGSWWVWDSARGIMAGNDPALQLNSTAAEITTADAVDPYSPGITVNQEATCSINANGVSYIFLAVA